jgi:hypothetical protein
MASILFSTVGQALGGPAGAAVGALAGSALDGALLPGTARGSTEQLVPRASYGEPLPRIYGRARVAGTLIWARPMRRTGGDKGGGQRRYVTSFAIALSSRPVTSIGRVWADGRQIRDAAGTFAFPVTMRLHEGRGARVPDPAVAASEGTAAPAHGRLAHVLFEDFPLAAFGNRIPALSFEVEADPAPTGSGAWLGDLMAAAGLPMLETASGGDGTGLVAQADRWGADAALLGLAADSEAGPGISLTHELAERPALAMLAYADPARDYLLGEQRETAWRPGAAATMGGGLVADAAVARALADRLLRRREAGVEQLRIRLPWAWLGIEPGDRVTVEGLAGTWRVAERRIVGLLVELDCRRSPDGGGSGLAGDPGRALLQPLVPAGPTLLRLVELPMGPGEGAAGGVMALVSGGAAWRGATLAWESGQVAADLGAVRDRQLIGSLVSPLASGPTTLWDEAATIDLLLDDRDQWLESRTAEGVLAGANMAVVGREAVQFREATPLGAGRFRLRGLLRGRLATDCWVTDHPAGTSCAVMVAAPVRIPADGEWVGRALTVLALGEGDPPGGTRLDLTPDGAATAPLGPVQLRVERLPDGDVVARWIARSRAWFGWSGGHGDADMRHDCHFRVAGGRGAVVTGVGAEARWPLVDQLALLGAPAGRVDVEVVARGDGPAALRRSRVAVLEAV